MPKDSSEVKRPLSRYSMILGAAVTFSVASLFLMIILIDVGWVKINHVHPASLLGLIATLTGLLATVFGIGLAGVVAFQWGAFEKKVDELLKKPIRRTEAKLEKDFARRMQAVAMLTTAWIKPLFERDSDIERILELEPGLQDIEPLMATGYLNERLSVDAQTGQPKLDPSLLSGYYEDKNVDYKEKLVTYADKWAKRAIKNSLIHTLGFPQWVSAIVAAYKKDTYNCLDYLKVAKQHGYLEQNGLIPFTYAWNSPFYQLFATITSCSPGQIQRPSIDNLVKLLELEPIDEKKLQEAMGEHFSKVVDNFVFFAIDKTTGDSNHFIIVIAEQGGRDPFSEPTEEGYYFYPKDWVYRFQYGSPPQSIEGSFEETIKAVFERLIPIRFLGN